ncbi:MAG: hypothetical protein WAW46_05415 [Polaromonas sp.]
MAKKNGLQVKRVEFSGFIRPNATLMQSEIDASFYPPANGVYSRMVKKLSDLEAA